MVRVVLCSVRLETASCGLREWRGLERELGRLLQLTAMCWESRTLLGELVRYKKRTSVNSARTACCDHFAVLLRSRWANRSLLRLKGSRKDLVVSVLIVDFDRESQSSSMKQTRLLAGKGGKRNENPNIFSSSLGASNDPAKIA